LRRRRKKIGAGERPQLTTTFGVVLGVVLGVSERRDRRSGVIDGAA
jgi:hypothetical protein